MRFSGSRIRSHAKSHTRSHARSNVRSHDYRSCDHGVTDIKLFDRNFIDLALEIGRYIR